MLSNKNTAALPSELKKYFWDVNFDELTFEKYPRFITERLLNFGDLNDLKWLLSLTDTQYIHTLIKTSRNLNAKTKNYWQHIIA